MGKWLSPEGGARSIRRARAGAIGRRQQTTGLMFVGPSVLYFLITFGLPLLYTMYLTATKFSLAGGPARFVGLTHYQRALTDDKLWLSIGNTFYFMILSVPVTVILALAAAMLFSSATRFRGKKLFRSIYFLPVITASVAVAFVWSWLYQPDIGLFNAVLRGLGLPRQPWLHSAQQVIPSLAAMQVWARLGFAMVIFVAGLEGIPGEYYEAARIDGAAGWSAFRRITLPLLNAQILLVCIIEVITSLKVFALPYVATAGGPGSASRTVVLHVYELAFKWMRMGEASVAALLLFAVIVGVSILQWLLLRKPVEY